METNTPLDDFFENWVLFQNIVARNYMYHGEIIHTLRAWAQANGKRGMRILDLGCGDAEVARRAFKGIDDIQYYGIDLSGKALEIARSNFENCNWNVELLEGDLTKLIQQLHGPFDLVIAGYSFHTLEHAAKSTTLNNIRLVLTPTGSLIIYDLLPRHREHQREYKKRLLTEAIDSWTLLSPEHLSSFKKHVESASHPIDEADWQLLAYESSLGKLKNIYRDPKEHFGVIRFSH